MDNAEALRKESVCVSAGQILYIVNQSFLVFINQNTEINPEGQNLHFIVCTAVSGTGIVEVLFQKSSVVIFHNLCWAF